VDNRGAHAAALALLAQLPVRREQRVLEVVRGSLLDGALLQDEARYGAGQGLGRGALGAAVEQPEQPLGAAEGRQPQLAYVQLLTETRRLREAYVPGAAGLRRARRRLLRGLRRQRAAVAPGYIHLLF